MYGREYEGRLLDFEASGGLTGASLVFQDRQTDSYWSLMRGEAIAGPLSGVDLEEIGDSRKLRWRDWRELHPDTLALSVDGREHAVDAYRDYFRSPRGFRGARSDDRRLRTKEPIFAFRRGGAAYAVRQRDTRNGAVFMLPTGESVFLFRPGREPIFRSTRAFVSADGFVEDGDVWTETATGARFDPEEGVFSGADVERLSGFDTFWYNWSLNNPGTEVLESR